jgi:hypothetical protein
MSQQTEFAIEAHLARDEWRTDVEQEEILNLAASNKKIKSFQGLRQNFKGF